MEIYGLIGKTLGHSFSQKYFSEKFLREKIRDCQYRNFELTDLEQEIGGLKSNPELRGLNVTIPYKTAILPFLETMTDECREIGACNCIQIKDGKWTGHNTDTVGFKNSFAPHLKPFWDRALILGTGGASNAVAFVLKELGIGFRKVSRQPRPLSGDIGYEDLNGELMEQYLVIINTTPVGTFPDMSACPPLPYNFVTNRHYCFDLIYNPAKTQFLTLCERRGARIENGSKMLAIQAEESWRIWKS